MCKSSINLFLRNGCALILLALFPGVNAGCVAGPGAPGYEEPVSPQAAKPSVHEMAVPDGYVETIPSPPKKDIC